MTLRRITLDDFPDCFDIAKESYSVPFDVTAMWNWAVVAIKTPTIIAIRDDDAFGFGNVTGLPWRPTELHGAMLYLAMRKRAVFQGCNLLKTMRDWSIRAMGAVDFQFGESSGMRMDVFARRLGAKLNRPTYVCEAR